MPRSLPSIVNIPGTNLINTFYFLSRYSLGIRISRGCLAFDAFNINIWCSIWVNVDDFPVLLQQSNIQTRNMYYTFPRIVACIPKVIAEILHCSAPHALCGLPVHRQTWSVCLASRTRVNSLCQTLCFTTRRSL